jgi:hypothetical protein
MKTIVIFDDYSYSPLSFYVREGDHSYADGQYLNSTTCTSKAADFIESLETTNNYNTFFRFSNVKWKFI